MNWSRLVEFINSLPADDKEKMHINVEENVIQYGFEDCIFKLSKEDNMFLSEESFVFSEDELTMHSKDYLEVLVDNRNRGYNPRVIDMLQENPIVDTDMNVTYRIAPMSLSFIIELFRVLEGKNLWVRKNIRMANRLRDLHEVDGDISLSQLLSQFYILPLSLVIESNSNLGEKYLKELENGYLFNIAYNLGFGYKKIRHIEEIFPQINRRRTQKKTNIEELEPPKRRYIYELTSQYYMALSSNDPFIEFLCYYHVMEHFFDEVYKEDIIKNVQDYITSPKFSVKRKKDVVKLIENIQKKTLSSKQEYRVNEEEALALTMKKYVPNLSELKESVDEIDSSLISYYKNHQVIFSKGDGIDLEDTSNEKVYKKIAARVYKTRNAIVHSKSNDLKSKEKGIYIPFKDEKELAREIPLMKIIAELIIIGSSEII